MKRCLRKCGKYQENKVFQILIGAPPSQMVTPSELCRREHISKGVSVERSTTLKQPDLLFFVRFLGSAKTTSVEATHQQLEVIHPLVQSAQAVASTSRARGEARSACSNAASCSPENCSLLTHRRKRPTSNR